MTSNDTRGASDSATPRGDPAVEAARARREQSLLAALVELADTLVADVDPYDVMHRLVEHILGVLDVDAVGLLLADSAGALQMVASSDHSVHVLELLQLRADQGPCVDAYRASSPVECHDLAADASRWPDWAPHAVGHGFSAVAALPLRLRATRIGALNLLCREPDLPSAGDLRAAQALADIATIGVLQQRAVADGHVLAVQLQRALDSRVVIEQAKGMLAQRLGVAPEVAFTLLRAHARTHGLALRALASDVVGGRLDLAATLRGTTPGAGPTGAAPPGAGPTPGAGGPWRAR